MVSNAWVGNLAVSALMATLATAAVAAPGRYNEHVLQLESALAPAAGPAQPLTLIVESVDGGWQPIVWGHARSYNRRESYFGRIVDSAAADGTAQLRVRMVIGTPLGGEAQRRNTPCEFSLGFREKDGAVEGTWKGTVGDKAGGGKVSGVVRSSAIAADFVAPAPAEHPRLLLRKRDLPALRAKAQTPLGRDLVKRLEAPDPDSQTRMAVGHAMLYALTGDNAYARKAQELLQTDYSSGKWVRTEVHYPYVNVHDAGMTAVEAAIALDLMWDGCDEAFREAMLELFAQRMSYFYAAPANVADSSNWSGIYRSGAGMCALSVLDEPARASSKPVAPEIRRLKPPAKVEVDALGGKGLRPAEFDTGAVQSWLMAGPLWRTIGLDLLAPLGKPPYRPTVATTVVSKATVVRDGKVVPCPNNGTSAFRIPARKEGPILPPFDLKGLAGGAARILYFYSTIDVKAAGTFQVRSPTSRITEYRIVLADQEVRDKDLVQLDTGRYPILIAMEPGDNRRAHKIDYAFALNRLAPAEAEKALAGRRQAYEEELSLWTFWSEAAADAKLNPMAMYWLGMARLLTGNYLRWAVGDFGWPMEGEGYGQHTYKALLPLAHCYRNVTGRPLIAGPNLLMVLPRYAGQTIFREGEAIIQGYSTGGAPLGVDGYARGFALVPDELKPAVLWAWNRTQALADAGKLKGPYFPVDRLDPMSAAFRLVNYPADMPERNPGELLPHVMVDKQRGGYIFRNGWKDGNDICATIFLNDNLAGGSWSGNDAGDFRISGLGVDWAVRGRGWAIGATPFAGRGEQNRVCIGEDVAAWHAPATFFQAGRDGSGILSMNLDQVYLGLKPGPKGRGAVKLSPRMCMAGDEKYDLGVRASRSFAADYSGASGAPGLFVVVDRITGSPRPPVWQMVTDNRLAVTTSEGAFTFKAPSGATLQATIVSPARAAATTRPISQGHEVTYDGDHRAGTFERTVIDVPGEELFIVVMTIQQGAGARAVIEGAGANASVRIGQRTIRFDGEKVVLEKFLPSAAP